MMYAKLTVEIFSDESDPVEFQRILEDFITHNKMAIATISGLDDVNVVVDEVMDMGD